MKKMLVVDGNSILNRAFYGIRLLTNKDGLYTNAIYGMVTILSKHLEQLKPDYCAVAFDLKAPTFRHKMYGEYKANRKGMPEELAVQLPYAKECMKLLGLQVVTCEGYEADDILGTLAGSVGKQDIHVYLLTGDRDSLQLIDDNVTVLLAKTKETVVFDGTEFQAQYGIPPYEFVDVKALMGDSSDNIPGVAGIGEKTALKLISEYHSLSELYRQLESSTLSDATKKKLESGKEMAFLSRKLAEICCKAPIELSPEYYAYNGPDRPTLKRFFIQLDFTALIKKFNLESTFDDTAPVTDTVMSTEQEHSSIEYREVTSADELCAHTVFVYAEESGIALFDGKALYTASLTNGTAPQLISFLSNKEIICYDSKAYYKAFLRFGAEPPKCSFDCLLAAYVLDSGRSNYSLSELVVRYNDAALSDSVAPVAVIPGLFDELCQRIKAEHFEFLLYDIEMPLAYVLAEMELCGFKIDCKGIEAYGHALKRAAEELQLRIYSYAGEEFNIGSPKQLGEVLFEKLGLPKARKTKTGYSTDAETLQKLINKHPIIEDILEYRQVTKLKSTYADGLIKAADTDGRVHSILNQAGTATGRLSSSEPNLQNIPVRTELGRQFRKFFVPQNGNYILIDADYSQIELRLLAHISNDTAMIEAFLSGEDIHTMTAARVFNVSPEHVTPDLRKKAKAVNFGIMYGIGDYSLSEDLGISRAQAKEYIESYFEKFPQIRAYLDRVQAEAKQNGYVTTFMGRRRYIPELASSNKNLQHFGERIAMNSPIQGTAADIIKIAMIRAAEQLKQKRLDAKLILQVHDELLIEANKDCAQEAEAILKACMEQAVSLSVPLSVEINSGETWYDAK